jgi:hypothetical protein
VKEKILTNEEMEALRKFSPHARFEIPSDLEGRAYCFWLEQLVQEMLVDEDIKNQHRWHGFQVEERQESGIGFVNIKGKMFGGCKLYWFLDDKITSLNYQKGLQFRDHEDKGAYTVQTIFQIADALREFLQSKKIAFTEFRRFRENHEEFVHKMLKA